MENENEASGAPSARPETAVMFLGDRTADKQPDAHAAFRGVEGIEPPRHVRRPSWTASPSGFIADTVLATVCTPYFVPLQRYRRKALRAGFLTR
jgi:hypothetical protein